MVPASLFDVYLSSDNNMSDDRDEVLSVVHRLAADPVDSATGDVSKRIH